MSIFDIFRRSKSNNSQENLRLDWMQIDMHSHLIPGIDDGAKTLEQSIELIQRLKGYGIKKIITTPHIMWEFYKNTPEIITNGIKALQEELSNQEIDIEILGAAEYYLDEFFFEKIKKGEQLLTVSDNLILVETGFIEKPAILLETLFELELQHYKPILAHPERYFYLLNDKKLVQDLLDREVYFQINLLSLTGFYSKESRVFAETLIDENRIKLVGTDCHNGKYLDALETLPQSKYYEKLQELDLLNKTL
ncbi:capsular polysaccharide biosynthesis protein [Belliella baltica DSM 15883]|uniref:protein-tyrosine-phosphatase n=1 Tax=Belliella baltica (strain DSM 15883 / CIP 108006 / LMG 21964 / BA134) TaxID=866536 RepID=I3Z2T6_BELBD|nr:CpsB/CapC family capsule biosynthesis tyrosine phosphatase [Belliella baltica]AFL83554.1 capsular polysaccharide biosynthesis protein [Belliella baltica DSM 15883]